MSNRSCQFIDYDDRNIIIIVRTQSRKIEQKNSLLSL